MPARISPGRIVVVLALAFALLAGSAMLRTSTTFDEIVFSAVGARGLRTGDFGMVNDHPRLPQYLFGLPVYLQHVNYPPEHGRWDWASRYRYAQALFWDSGNLARRITLAARVVALVFGTLTVAATYLLARRHMSDWAALAAAALVAFFPDMLAQSGVAYNDIVLTFGLLGSVYALDAAVRRPRAWRVALAAFACAATVCVKYSGAVLGPILLALLAMEARSGRWQDRAWRRALWRAVPVFALVAYGTVVLVYLGDWRLGDFLAGLDRITGSALAGRPAFLLGEHHLGGWWYFFPVAFLLKTPAALHVLMLVALGGAWWAAREARGREWLAHPARAPAAAVALFAAALLLSGMNIGFRHALPAIPLLCILVAQGLEPVWARGRGLAHAAILVLFAGYAGSTLSRYPDFLSYLSEYVRGRPLYDTLVDSNTDWGQGLVALRDYMRERGIDRVALGYFGSALPEGYGIRYVALPSFLDLPRQAAGLPRYLVVSATLLAGDYAKGDPYAALRRARPVAVVAHTLYVYDRRALGPAWAVAFRAGGAP